jgi:hypothetical protein
MEQQEKRSYKGTGNRCGHKPEKPRLPPLPTGQYRPNPIMELAMGLIPFAHNADFFPEIDATNGSKRHMRSELREACLMLAAALFYYYDSVSRAVAIPTNDGTLVVKSMAFFALMAGLRIRRAWRAFKSLLGSKFFYREGDLIKVSLNYIRRLEDLTGKKVLMALEALAKKNIKKRRKEGKPPIDGQKIKRDRESAAIAAAKETNNETPEERARRIEAGREQLQLLRGSRAFPGGGGPPAGVEADQRRRTQLFLELRREHPDLPIEKVFELVTRHLADALEDSTSG